MIKEAEGNIMHSETEVIRPEATMISSRDQSRYDNYVRIKPSINCNVGLATHHPVLMTADCQPRSIVHLFVVLFY